MADNRKYYYLKLKENFFDSDSIVLLEDMKDGILYSNILLKLYLKSLKNGGRLQLDEHIPYTAQMIATLTRHQIGTVERALAIFQQLGLVEQLDCGLLYMTDIELMIGQSSTEAERKRAARLENKALLPPRTNGGHLPGAAGLCGLRKGVFARGASSLLFRRLQGRREPPKKPGTHEENAGEKAGRLLRFVASKGLTFRAFWRVFPGWEYLITFLPGLPSYFVTSSTSGHVDPRHRKEGSLGDSTRICDFESCHL